jgi:hypothetical protein
VAVVASGCHLATQPIHLTSSPLATSPIPPPSLEVDSSRRLEFRYPSRVVGGDSTPFLAGLRPVCQSVFSESQK